MTRVTAFAPGKLIISGEHSVVHGAPAIAMAVDCGARAITEIKPAVESLVTLSMRDFAYEKTYTLNALRELYELMRLHYSEYLSGDRAVNRILREPPDLLWYALAEAFFEYNLNEPGAIAIEIQTDIPVGCGMGSSAAITAALLCGLYAVCGKSLSTEALFPMVHAVENLQHGNSSGLDPCVVAQGGFIWFQNGKFKKLASHSIPFYFINTGRPASSTGECVQTSSLALRDKQLLQRFSECTQHFAADLQNGHTENLGSHIRENHRLLCEVGVVPNAIQKLISQIEEAGGSAKICGAGSVSGEQAGMLLVTGAEDVVKARGYLPLAISLSEQGACLIGEW